MTGRQAFEERFGFRVKGEFRVRGLFEIPLTGAGLLLMVLGTILLVVKMADPMFAFGGTFGALPFAIAIWVMLCWWVVRIAHSGVTCRYEGDDDEFRITDNRKHTEIFYYPDVTGIEYKPLRYLNKRQRGYIVTIHTKYRAVKYEYIATGRQRVNSPEDTPFFLLEQHCGLTRDITPENNDGRT